MTQLEYLKSLGISEKRIADFVAYHQANPEIWKYFQEFSLEAAKIGKSIGANAIRERIRWEVEIELRQDFKFNNNYTPLYARMFVKKYPQFADFFEFRDLKEDVKELS